MFSALLFALLVQGVPPASAAQLTELYTLFVEGQALADDGDLSGAIAKYKRALDVVPTAAEIRAELAGAYAQQGDLAAAETEATRALATEPDNRSAHRLLGLIVASRVGRADRGEVQTLATRAIGHLEKSNALSIRDPVVMLTLGELYLRAGNQARAIAMLEQFLVDRPGYPQAMMLLAQAYRESGRSEGRPCPDRRVRGHVVGRFTRGAAP